MIRTFSGRGFCRATPLIGIVAAAGLLTLAFGTSGATSASPAPRLDGRRPLPDPATTSGQPTDTPGWTRHDTGLFSVELPAVWQYIPRQGIDSFVGEFVGDDIRLLFDYGDWWLRGPETGDPGYRVLHERVDHRAAEIWLPVDAPADYTALYVDHVFDSPGRSFSSTKLSLVGLDLTEEQQATALAIMRSTRFKRTIPAAGNWETVLEIPGASLLDVEVLDRDHVRMSGSVGGTGVIYEARPPDAAATLFNDTWSIAGLSRDWALEYGGRQVFHRMEGGNWQRLVVDTPNLLFDLHAGWPYVEEPDLWVTGIGAVMRYADGAWTEVPGVGGGVSLDVASSSGGWGWAAGGRVLSRMKDGAWHDVPWPGAPNTSVLAVDALTPDEAWFAGGRDNESSGLLFEYRSGEWAERSAVAQGQLWGIDLVSPAEGWAVGGGAGGTTPCAVMRLVEGAWEEMSGVCMGQLHAVRVALDGTTWAVGYRGASGDRVGLLLRYRSAESLTPTATATATATGTTDSPSPTHSPVPIATDTARPALIPFAVTDR